MNKIVKGFYRAYQFIMSLAVPLLPWKDTKLISRPGSIANVPNILKKEGIHTLFIATTKGTLKRGYLNGILDEFRGMGIKYHIFSNINPDPTISSIEEGVAEYNSHNCNGILAVGGGSVIDCSKVIGARAVKPSISVAEMKGILKIRKKLPTFIAVPTTAGTGSECTLAAVITDEKTHYKYPINDPCLLPDYAILDGELTKDLPPHLTAQTGMDAMTHSTEAYINKFSSKESKSNAIKSLTLIHSNLLKAYNDGNDIEARQNMLEASFYAGRAFTKAYVGYVHAIGHAIGGIYGMPHGLTMAILLPKVLRKYRTKAEKSLSEIAIDLGESPSLSPKELSQRFIALVEGYNTAMEIPDNVASLSKSDYGEIARRTLKEANPLYPVPEIWSEKEIFEVLDEMR